MRAVHDEGRLPGRPPQLSTTSSLSRVAPEAVSFERRTTGLQALQAALEGLLQASRTVCSPREHSVFVDLAQRRLERERQEHDFSFRRWAA